MNLDWVAWGTAAEWVSGVGALAAAGVALFVSSRAEKAAETNAVEARKGASRDRTLSLMIDLVRVLERDCAAGEAPSGDKFPVWSAEGAGLCRGLWGHRGSFGTVWHFYCEKDRKWMLDLHARGELVDRMKDEVQRAIDLLDYEDRSGTGKPPKP